MSDLTARLAREAYEEWVSVFEPSVTSVTPIAPIEGAIRAALDAAARVAREAGAREQLRVTFAGVASLAEHYRRGVRARRRRD